MKVHLVKSAEVDAELFTKVVDFLQSIPGVIQFVCDHRSVTHFETDEVFKYVIRDENHFEKKVMPAAFSCEKMLQRIDFPLERETANWDALFKKAALYRKTNLVAENEFVILLTDIANNQNWFAALDEKMPYNGFIHTADWDYYIRCSAAFPIAYEVVALVLRKFMFKNMSDLQKHVHQEPIGCINDFCGHKKQIILKLRTGDVCEDCIQRTKGSISMPVLYHALQLFSSLREKMLFAQNLKQFTPLSKLSINAQHKIFLPDFDQMEIKLRPLEKALYFLFLQHPEGIYLSSLSEHRQELYTIYAQISAMGDLQEMKLRIDDMVNALSDSASQKMSRIKRVFEEAVGKSLAAHYYIKGDSGQKKKIELSRSMVVFDAGRIA